MDFFGLDLSRISTILLAQLSVVHSTRTLSTHMITDEIKYLEGLKPHSQTLKADQFRKEPLRGLWKKHFSDPQFLIRNIGNHFGLNKGGNERLTQMIAEAFKRNTSGYFDDEFAHFLAHEFTIGAYDKRFKMKKMTGEWIVFQKHQGKNYYLTFGLHANDDWIYRHVNLAIEFDYPFLKGTFGK